MPPVEDNCYSCCSSVAKSCPTLCKPWTAARQAPLSSAISQSLLQFMSNESVMLSDHLILCPPPLLLKLSTFPSIRTFSNESIIHIRWPKYWSFSLSNSLSNEHSGLISFRTDSPCSPRDSQESSPTPQFKSINSSVLSLLNGLALTSIHDYWKNQSFDSMNLCQKSEFR